MCSSPDQAAKAAENATTALTQAQSSFITQTLMPEYNTVFGENQAIVKNLTSTFNSIIQNPKGFSPADLAAMRTSGSDQTATATQSALQATQSAMASRGGSDLPSGVDAQITGSIMNSGAQANAATQNQITEADEAQKQHNYWSAIAGLGGVANDTNPNAASSAIASNTGAGASAGNSVANLSQAVTASSQAGWADVGAVMSGIGSLAGGAASLGTMAKAPCWIAAATFNGGWNDVRTLLVRHWLTTEFIKTWYGKLTMKLYMTFGERVAKVDFLVRMLRPLMFRALERAA